MKVRTVVIESNGAPLVINESDFRYGSDVLWDEVKEVATAPAVEVEAEEVAEAEEEVVNDVVVKHKGGGRWTVTVNDQSVHEGTLSKKDAQALAAEY